MEQKGGSHSSTSPRPWRPPGPREPPTEQERPVLDMARAEGVVRTSESSTIDRFAQKTELLRRHFPKHAFSKTFARLQEAGAGIVSAAGSAGVGGGAVHGHQQGGGAASSRPKTPVLLTGSSRTAIIGTSVSAGALGEAVILSEDAALLASELLPGGVRDDGDETKLNRAHSDMKIATGTKTPEWVNEERRYLRLHGEKKGDVNARALDRRLDQYSIVKPGGLRKGVPSMEEFEANYGPSVEAAQRERQMLIKQKASAKKEQERDAGTETLAILLGKKKAQSPTKQKATSSDLLASLGDEDFEAQMLCRRLDARAERESRVPKNVHTRYRKEEERRIFQRNSPTRTTRPPPSRERASKDQLVPPSPLVHAEGSSSKHLQGGSTSGAAAGPSVGDQHAVQSSSIILPAESSASGAGAHAATQPGETSVEEGAAAPSSPELLAANTTSNTDGTAATSPAKRRWTNAVAKLSSEKKLQTSHTALAEAATILLEDPNVKLLDPDADLSGPMAQYKKHCDKNELPRLDLQKVFTEVEKYRNLTLKNLELSVLHCHSICKVLETMPSAQFLSVTNCLIPDKGIELLLNTCLESLTSLHLENVNLSLQSIQLLYKALYPRRRHCVLQHLFLKGCGLGSEDEIPGYKAWDSDDEDPDEYDDSEDERRRPLNEDDYHNRDDDEEEDYYDDEGHNDDYVERTPDTYVGGAGGGAPTTAALDDEENFPPPTLRGGSGTDALTQQLREEAAATGETTAYTDNDPTRRENILREEDSLAAEDSMLSGPLFSVEEHPGGGTTAAAAPHGPSAGPDPESTRREIMGSRGGSRGHSRGGGINSRGKMATTYEDHGFDPRGDSDTVVPISPMHDDRRSAAASSPRHQQHARSAVADYATRREKSVFQGLGANCYEDHQLGRYWIETVEQEEEEAELLDRARGYQVSASPSSRTGTDRPNTGDQAGSAATTANDPSEVTASRPPSQQAPTATVQVVNATSKYRPNPKDPSQRAMPPAGSNPSDVPDDGRFLKKLHHLGGIPEEPRSPLAANDPRADAEYSKSPLLDFAKSPECKKLQAESPTKGVVVPTTLPKYKKKSQIEAGDVPKHLLESGTGGSRVPSRQGTSASSRSASTLADRRDVVAGDVNVPGVRRHRLHEEPNRTRGTKLWGELRRYLQTAKGMGIRPNLGWNEDEWGDVGAPQDGDFSMVHHYTVRKDRGKQDLALVATRNQLKKERKFYRGVRVRAVPDGFGMFSHALDVLRVRKDWNGYPPDIWHREEEEVEHLEGYPVVMPVLALSMVTHLNTLDLTANVLSPRGWSVFEQLLGRTKSLEVLVLDETGLSDLCIHPFCAGLRHNVSLKSLSMRSVMLLRDDSLILLLQTLEKHPALVFWNYLDNGWGEKMLGLTSEDDAKTVATVVRTAGSSSTGGFANTTSGGTLKDPNSTSDMWATTNRGSHHTSSSLSPTERNKSKLNSDGGGAVNKVEEERHTVIGAFRSLLNRAVLLSCIHASLPECTLQQSLLKERGWHNHFKERGTENVVIWRALFCRDFYHYPRTRVVAEAERKQLAGVATREAHWIRGGYRDLVTNVTNATGLLQSAVVAAEQAEAHALMSGTTAGKDATGGPQHHNSTAGGGAPSKMKNTSTAAAAHHHQADAVKTTSSSSPHSPTSGMLGIPDSGIFEAANKDFCVWYCDALEAPAPLLTVPHLEACKQFLQSHAAVSSDSLYTPPSTTSTVGFPPDHAAAGTINNSGAGISTRGRMMNSAFAAASSTTGAGGGPVVALTAQQLSATGAANTTTSFTDAGTSTATSNLEHQRAVDYFETSYQTSGSRQGRRGRDGRQKRSTSVDSQTGAGDGTMNATNSTLLSNSNPMNTSFTASGSGTIGAGGLMQNHTTSAGAPGQLLGDATSRHRDSASSLNSSMHSLSVSPSKKKSRHVVTKRPGKRNAPQDYFKNRPPQVTKQEQIERIMAKQNEKKEQEKQKELLKQQQLLRQQQSSAHNHSFGTFDLSSELSTLAQDPSLVGGAGDNNSPLFNKEQENNSLLAAPTLFSTTTQMNKMDQTTTSLDHSVRSGATGDSSSGVPLGQHSDFHALERQVVPHPIHCAKPHNTIKLSRSWVADRVQMQEFVWNFPRSGSQSGHSVHLCASFYDYCIVPMNLVLQTNRNHVFRVGCRVPSYCEFVYYFFYDPATRKMFHAQDQPHLKIRNKGKWYREYFLKSVSKASEANLEKPSNAPGGMAENVTSIESIFGLFDIDDDMPDFVNYRRIHHFHYPTASPVAQVQLHHRAPMIGEVHDKSLEHFQREYVDDEEHDRLDECYDYDMKKISLEGICGENEEKLFRKTIKKHYLELYQSYALLTGGELYVRSVDVMAFFDEMVSAEVSSLELMKFIESVGHSAVRFFRHEFVHLCLLVGITLYPQPSTKDAPKSLTLLVEKRLRKAIGYPLNPFSKSVMQNPIVNKMTYDCMDILKDAYLRYGTHKAGFMQLIYILRINDRNFTARHLACIFALAQKYKPRACEQTEHECTRMTYPEFCEAIVRIAAGGLPQEEKRYRGQNLSLFPPKLVKVSREFCVRIQTKIRENIRRMNQYKIG
ncbi:unnamed protein product [Amoebophrya sp. A120]|nr:unnamed protein product [Amoebophrya sp. A120]|eukprot:GSA120T00017731001.1